MIENRKHTRVPFKTSVYLEFENFSGFVTEYSHNLSEGGLFILSNSPLPVGSIVSFEFKLKDQFHLVQGMGEVMWTQTTPDDQRPCGMGIEFRELSSQSRTLIASVVEQIKRKGEKPFSIDEKPYNENFKEVFSNDAPNPSSEHSVEKIQTLFSIDENQAEDFPELNLSKPPQHKFEKDYEKLFSSDLDVPEGTDPLNHSLSHLEGTIPSYQSLNESDFKTEINIPALKDESPSQPPPPAPPGPPHKKKPLVWFWILPILGLLGLGFVFKDALFDLLLKDRELEEMTQAPTQTPPTPFPDETSPLPHDEGLEKEAGTQETTQATETPISPEGEVPLTPEVIAEKTPAKAIETPLPSPTAASIPSPKPSPKAPSKTTLPVELPFVTPPVTTQVTPSPVPPTPSPTPTVEQQKIKNITWSVAGNKLIVLVESNKRFLEKNISTLSVRDDHPREVIKILDMGEPFSTLLMPVGQMGLTQIRIGHHKDATPPEMHLVVDLSDPKVLLEKIEVTMSILKLHFVKPTS